MELASGDRYEKAAVRITASDPFHRFVMLITTKLQKPRFCLPQVVHKPSGQKSLPLKKPSKVPKAARKEKADPKASTGTQGGLQIELPKSWSKEQKRQYRALIEQWHPGEVTGEGLLIEIGGLRADATSSFEKANRIFALFQRIHADPDQCAKLLKLEGGGVKGKVGESFLNLMTRDDIPFEVSKTTISCSNAEFAGKLLSALMEVQPKLAARFFARCVPLTKQYLSSSPELAALKELRLLSKKDLGTFTRETLVDMIKDLTKQGAQACAGKLLPVLMECPHGAGGAFWLSLSHEAVVEARKLNPELDAYLTKRDFSLEWDRTVLIVPVQDPIDDLLDESRQTEYSVTQSESESERSDPSSLQWKPATEETFTSTLVASLHALETLEQMVQRSKILPSTIDAMTLAIQQFRDSPTMDALYELQPILTAASYHCALQLLGDEVGEPDFKAIEALAHSLAQLMGAGYVQTSVLAEAILLSPGLQGAGVLGKLAGWISMSGDSRLLVEPLRQLFVQFAKHRFDRTPFVEKVAFGWHAAAVAEGTVFAPTEDGRLAGAEIVLRAGKQVGGDWSYQLHLALSNRAHHAAEVFGGRTEKEMRKLATAVRDLYKQVG